MRDRLILATLGILMIVAAGVIFALSRVDPPPRATTALTDEHDHAAEILPPAPVGRTLFGGNSGELRSSPVAVTGVTPVAAIRATPVIRTGTPVPNPSFDVFAPARFQATPTSN